MPDNFETAVENKPLSLNYYCYRLKEALSELELACSNVQEFTNCGLATPQLIDAREILSEVKRVNIKEGNKLSDLETKMLFLLRVAVEAKGDDKMLWRKAAVELISEVESQCQKSTNP